MKRVVPAMLGHGFRVNVHPVVVLLIMDLILFKKEKQKRWTVFLLPQVTFVGLWLFCNDPKALFSAMKCVLSSEPLS